MADHQPRSIPPKPKTQAEWDRLLQVVKELRRQEALEMCVRHPELVPFPWPRVR